MNFINIVILALLFMILFDGCRSHKVYRQSTMVSRPASTPKMDNKLKQQYLHAVNKVRSQGRNCGSAGYFAAASAVRWSDALYKAAYEHSHDMSQSKLFSHQGSSGSSDWTAKVQHLDKGSSFKARIENNGYKQWKNIAENIEMGSSTVDSAMDHWVGADKHCANIMNPDFTDVGMAYVKKPGSHSTYYWTQTFAAHQ